MPWELPALIGDEAARAGLERLRALELIGEAMTLDPGTDFGRVAALEAGLYMRNQLLRDSDWAGMAHGIEIRVPLVDTKLLRHVAPLLLAYETVQVFLKSPERRPAVGWVERSETHQSATEVVPRIGFAALCQSHNEYLHNLYALAQDDGLWGRGLAG